MLPETKNINMLVKIKLQHLADLCIKHDYSFEECYQSVVDKSENDILTMDTVHKNFPHTLKEAAHAAELKKVDGLAPTVPGVGTEMKTLLSDYLGIKTNASCKCNQRANEMNAKGVDWCEANKDLIVSWLQEETKRRKMPFIKTAAITLINIAIWK